MKTMFAPLCLLLAVVFTMTHQDEIRKENNAFVRDCNGLVRLEYNLRQCVGAKGQT